MGKIAVFSEFSKNIELAFQRLLLSLTPVNQDPLMTVQTELFTVRPVMRDQAPTLCRQSDGVLALKRASLSLMRLAGWQASLRSSRSPVHSLSLT